MELKQKIARVLMMVDFGLMENPMDPIQRAEIEMAMRDPEIRDFMRKEWRKPSEVAEQIQGG